MKYLSIKCNPILYSRVKKVKIISNKDPLKNWVQKKIKIRFPVIHT